MMMLLGGYWQAPVLNARPRGVLGLKNYKLHDINEHHTSIFVILAWC
jgi:hypothetical protein